MDLTVLIGIIGAIASISIGDILEGGNPVHVVHITSLIIVIPTAMFAAAAACETSAIKAAFIELKMVFKQLPIDFESRIDELNQLCQDHLGQQNLQSSS